MTIEVALLLQQQRQRREPVELGHLDVENDDVGIGALELVDRLSAGPQRGDDLEPRLLLDPARDEAAHDDRVIHHHDADRSAAPETDAAGTAGRGDDSLIRNSR